MRTFIAIPLPEPCRDMLEQMTEKLRRCGADVRWVAASSIHLTLKFLGEVQPDVLERLAGPVGQAAGLQSPLELRIGGLGCFPNPNRPRVIWCGVDGNVDGLGRLQQHVEDACRAFGFVPEDRPFRPHLTLGRVKGERNLQPLGDYIKMGCRSECSFTADHLNIYRSTLKPQGAVYSVLKTFRMGV